MDALPGATDPKDEAELAGETHAMVRIESAIPSEPTQYDPSSTRDRIPHARFLVTAVLVAVVVMSGTVLAITHPWDPGAFDTKAKTEADTSHAGFPGTVTELQGQEGGSATTEVKSGDDATLEQLQDYYEQLGALATRPNENESLFHQVYADTDPQRREDGKDAADALAIEVSNLISAISSANVESGTYVNEQRNLVTLGNWLRNRMDSLCDAWDADVSSDDPSADKDRILASLQNDGGASATDSYRVLFEQNYPAWKPERKGSS